MGAYFEAINDYGTYLIDDTYINWALVQNGTVTISNSGNGFGSTTVFKSNIVAPVIAWNSGDTLVCASNIAPSGNDCTWTLTAQTSGSVTITYYIFDVNAGISGENYGIQTFAADGRLVYDSGWKTAIIKDVPFLDYNDPGDVSTAGGTKNYAPNDGRVYAIGNTMQQVKSTATVIAVPGGPNGNQITTRVYWWLWYSMGKAGTGSYSVSDVNFFTSQFTGSVQPPHSPTYSSFLVFDVTGY